MSTSLGGPPGGAGLIRSLLPLKWASFTHKLGGVVYLRPPNLCATLRVCLHVHPIASCCKCLSLLPQTHNPFRLSIMQSQSLTADSTWHARRRHHGVAAAMAATDVALCCRPSCSTRAGSSGRSEQACPPSAGAALQPPFACLRIPRRLRRAWRRSLHQRGERRRIRLRRHELGRGRKARGVWWEVREAGGGADAADDTTMGSRIRVLKVRNSAVQ